MSNTMGFLSMMNKDECAYMYMYYVDLSLRCLNGLSVSFVIT